MSLTFTRLRLALCIASLLGGIGGCSVNDTSQQKDEPTTSTANEAKPIEWSSYEHLFANEFTQFCSDNYAKVETLFSEISNGKYQQRALLEELNELDRLLNITLGRASLYANVHPESDVRDAAEACDQNFTNLISDITLSQSLFKQVNKIDISLLSGVDRRYAEDTLQDFKRSGVNLSEDKRAQVKALNETINNLGMAFYKNSREDVRTINVDKKRLNGLPADFIDERTDADTGLVTITTNYPDYYPVMQYAEDDTLRLELYRLFRSRGRPANEPVLKELLQSRYEFANIVGYKHYADFATEVNMIGNAKKAQSFIDEITEIASPLANQEYDQLLAELQKTEPNATSVGDWQKTFLQEIIKKEQYSVDSQIVRQYFPYNHVKKGIFQLVEQMFEVEIREWDGPLWHDSVTAYEIVENGKVLGQFYLDMHPRDGKYKHAAAFTVQDGIENEQLPIKALVCNFPSGGELMEHVQVETFLHEFGHLLHGIFGGSPKWIAHAGTATERDFVEAPSQMLEEWVWDRETLQLLSADKNGKPIPDELIEKMNKSRHFGKGLFTTQQMFYAAISLNYYNRQPDTFDDTQLLAELQEKYSNFDYVEGTSFQYAFGHLVGYSAAYYGYMWSLVIAEDMFSEFQTEGLMNRDVAARYREAVLNTGGTQDATTMVEAFLGRPYTFDAFAKKFQ